ncbi:hypothetical protein BVC80_9049g22 [Macleaya cordata]|uniref:Uncharacterized protein n=1 Tax=Macleaya cordata TaxID=56857 RepID=A0A200R2J3_MACCD|nr:hypothetical protein BVC80_9049g22 [Macleaya cordata]
MNKEKKVSCYSPLLRKMSSFFNVKSSNSKLPTGPEAVMVAAAKHFSTAHKVRLG